MLAVQRRVKSVSFQIKTFPFKATRAHDVHANIMPLHAKLAPGAETKGQNIFSESGHIVSQIKENEA